MQHLHKVNYKMNQLTIVLSNDSNDGAEGSFHNNYSSMKSSNNCPKSERSIGSLESPRENKNRERKLSERSNSTPDWKQGSDFDTGGFNLTSQEKFQESSDGS